MFLTKKSDLGLCPPTFNHVSERFIHVRTKLKKKYFFGWGGGNFQKYFYTFSYSLRSDFSIPVFNFVLT